VRVGLAKLSRIKLMQGTEDRLENIQVAVRIRPFLSREAASSKVYHAADPSTIVDDAGRAFLFGLI
jgi:hypothetical protein